MEESPKNNNTEEKKKEEGKEANAKNEKGGEERQEQQQPKQQVQQQDQAKEQQKAQEDKDKEVEELRDRLLRMAAEFDNYKKKIANDMKSAKDVGKAELVSKLLPAIDAFEIALYASNGKDEKETYKGFELVFSEIMETLKKEGLQEIQTDGKYDPYKHEVILTRPSDKEEGTIIEVVRKGYMFNGIMLRPASVIISSGKKE